MIIEPVRHASAVSGVGDAPATATSVDLATAGYTEREFVLHGTAKSFRENGEWTGDGRWSVTESTQASYRTRLLVRAPADPGRFNGTVVVEWLNVSGGADVDVDFGYLHTELLQGYAWVGVSAQAAGVNSTGGSPLGPNVVGLKAWSPDRYGTLHHPGDAYSYDIFTQAGAALRVSYGEDGPLPGVDDVTVIAVGQSQSAMRMLTYANAIQPVARVFDGLFIHSRAGFGAPLGAGTGVAALDGPSGPSVVAPARVRTDLDVPVFQIVTETELFELGGSPERSFDAARQPDGDRIRTWEIAGAAHSDAHSLRILYPQYTAQFGTIRDLSAVIPIVNDGPQALVASAALRALCVWIIDGAAPPVADPIATADGQIVRDRFGNALGGVRTPHVDVPVCTLTGETVQVPNNGATTPFTRDVLASLYPDEGAYVTAFAVSVERAVVAGFIRPDDGQALIAAGGVAVTV
ncbi:hypothetical protein G4X40_21985 [Rhodococcus sp. D2-41]|nr:hypothetical protein [Rhodococcus sp. D2-41]